MAASMLAACDNDNTRRETTETAQPGESGYISTNGEGEDVDEMVIDRTANSPEADAETPAFDEDAEEARVRKVLAKEEERLTYWTLEENRITEDNPETLKASLEQMEKNFTMINADIKNAETGTFNPKGQLSREGQTELKQAQQKFTEAKNMHKQASQRFEAGKHEAAASKLKDANEKLAEAREEYMEALEKETGVEREDEVL